MKVDMSPQAVTARLKLLNQLWELSIKLLLAQRPKTNKRKGVRDQV